MLIHPHPVPLLSFDILELFFFFFASGNFLEYIIVNSFKHLKA